MKIGSKKQGEVPEEENQEKMRMKTEGNMIIEEEIEMIKMIKKIREPKDLSMLTEAPRVNL